MKNNTVAPLRMERFIPIRDVRKMIWRHLNKWDREMILYAHNSSKRFEYSRDILAHFFVNGCLNVVKWMREHYVGRRRALFEYDCSIYVRNAILNGHPKMFHLAVQRFGVVPCQDHLNAFAKVGRLDMLIWFQKHHRSLFGGSTLSYAMEGGHLDVIQWILNIEPVCSEYCVMSFASDAASLDTIKWLMTQKKFQADFDKDYMCRRAAERGTFDILEWLSLPPHNLSLNGVSNNTTNTKTLLWLHQHGASMNWERTKRCALMQNDVELLKVCLGHAVFEEDDLIYTLLRWNYEAFIFLVDVVGFVFSEDMMETYLVRMSTYYTSPTCIAKVIFVTKSLCVRFGDHMSVEMRNKYDSFLNALSRNK